MIFPCIESFAVRIGSVKSSLGAFSEGNIQSNGNRMEYPVSCKAAVIKNVCPYPYLSINNPPTIALPDQLNRVTPSTAFYFPRDFLGT